MTDPLPRLIVVTGPTASGKTDLAIHIAERLGTEIISADSRQIYKGIPITTAVPSPEQLARVRHHFVETLDLDTYYSAAMFAEDALALLPDIFNRCASAVVCGGSMMYIDALVRGIDDLPTITPEVRRHVADLHAAHGDRYMCDMLHRLDPEYYAEAELSNMRRVIHAIEITLQGGRPYSAMRTGTSTPRPFRVEKYAIDMPREMLFDRINRRVEAMVAAGMEAEARRVYPLRHRNALNTVGFKEWFDHFDALASPPAGPLPPNHDPYPYDREAVIARIAKNTRVYAKKQMTWLRRDPSVRYISPGTIPDIN